MVSYNMNLYDFFKVKNFFYSKEIIQKYKVKNLRKEELNIVKS